MTKAQDNLFPYISVVETSVPANPAAGKQKLYIDPSDHKLKMVDSSGTVTVISSSAAPVMASDKKTRTAGDYTGLTSTSFADVDGTNLSITLTTGARRCLITVNANGVFTVSGSDLQLDILLDGARLGGTYGLVLVTTTTSDVNLSFSHITDTLSAGSHTFKLQYRVGAGTAKLFASSAIAPLIMAVCELPTA